MTTMSKVILTVEQAEALKEALKENEKEDVIRMHSKCSTPWLSYSEPLNALSGMQMAQALINGWKVEEETTTSKIDKWIKDRNIHTGEPAGQMLKLAEEMGELAGAIARNNLDEVEDGIGDMGVVLRSLCAIYEITFEGCLELAYNEIKDRKGKMINGVFVKESDLNE